MGQIELDSLHSADESFMSVKQRISVQASEFHKRIISVYAIVIAIVQKDTYRLLTLIDDESISTFHELIYDPSSSLLVAYEV